MTSPMGEVKTLIIIGMMVKSNGNARHGVWEKGIYQKSGQDLEVQGGGASDEKPIFPLYDVLGNSYSGFAQVEYSNGDSYSGEYKDGFKNGDVN